MIEKNKKNPPFRVNFVFIFGWDQNNKDIILK